VGKILCGWHPMYYPDEPVPVLGEFLAEGDSHGICDRCRAQFEAEAKPLMKDEERQLLEALEEAEGGD
jgi:hypothetical protein